MAGGAGTTRERPSAVRPLVSLVRSGPRALLASLTATSCDLAVLVALVWLGVCAPGMAAVAGCLVGGLVGFHATRTWVFREDRAAAGKLRQGVAYGTLVVGGGALWSGALVQLATTAGAAIPAAKLGAAALVWGGWNLPVSRAVFRRKDTP